MLRNVRRRIEGAPVNEMPQAGGRDARRRRAIAIAAKINQKFPYATFGRAYVRRGSQESLDQFGQTYRTASAVQKDNRKRYGYVGRGLYGVRDLRNDYETLMGKRVSRAISSKLASTIRSLPFSGSGLYSGRGLYTNNLIAGGTGSVPMVSGSGDETGSITITHQEYITDVYGPGVFTSGSGGPIAPSFENIAFPINPGMEQTFPWLSQIAQNFEEYEFKQLIFHYTSTITDIGSSTSGQCGTLTMATDYNAAHEAFSDKQEMLGYAHSFSCKTTESMDHGVECDPSKNAISKVLYVRAYNLATTEDIKTYDHGIFQLAITNIPYNLQGQALGELRVSYTVTLRKPKLFSGRGLGISRDYFVTNSVNATADVRNLIAADSLIYKGQFNNLNCLITGNVAPPSNAAWRGFSITFPDYYTGALQVIVNVRCLAASIPANYGMTIQPPETQGNVTLIKDLYSQDGEPAAFMIPTNVNAGTYSPTDVDVYAVITVFVRASSGGVDNRLFISGWQVAGGPLVQTYVNIMEYNAYDKTNPNAVTNLVSPAGTVVAGNATL